MRRRPVFVTLQHPPSSRISKFLRYWAILPKEVSVTCLQRDKLSSVSDGTSLMKAWDSPMSVTL